MGADNVCERVVELGARGLGRDGDMTEFMLVPDGRYLVPLGELNPVDAAPLTDAGLTPYHAIKQALPVLTSDATAVVIGVGGLGHLAIQVLRAITAARVIGLDVREDKLAQARESGADLCGHPHKVVLCRFVRYAEAVARAQQNRGDRVHLLGVTSDDLVARSRRATAVFR
jgi:D-arabinose 1-dehydrogenase-like Zn-dependent alcohol dehydrogenase